MAQHEKDPAAQSSGAETASDNDRRTTDVARLDVAERHYDEAISAPSAGESDAFHIDESAADDGAVASSTAGVLQPAAAPRKKSRQVFTLLAATLGLLATAGVIGAYRFRDRHEKLAAFADIVDKAFAQPEKLVSLARETSLKWLGDAAKPSRETVEPGPGPEPAPPPPRAEPERTTAVETAPEKPGVTSRGSDERITWSAPPQSPAPTPPVAVESNAAPAAPQSEAVEALTKRFDRLEQVARSALQAAEEARASANASSSAPAAHTAAPSTETQDALAGLEGRIDELADEIKALRERFDAPKSETRLPLEQADNKVSDDGGKKADPAAIVVVAHSLQKALERGAPFASEYAALSAQGADPEALAALAPLAEGGAPTARQLLASFHPLVKQLEAIVEPKSDAPLGDRLLHEVGKLVKVRPAGEQPVATIAEIAAKIEAALGRDDVAAARNAFDELPENAKAVAQNWKEAAQRRLEAEKAAATILSGAIAALGKSKS